MRHRIAIVMTLAVLAAQTSGAAAIDKYQVTPEEHAACDADAVRLCSSAFPDQEKIFACMKASRGQLTPTCLAALRAGMKRRNLGM